MKNTLKLVCILLLFSLMVSCGFAADDVTPQPPRINLTEDSITLKVHYIDVGQGNAVLIEADGSFMLIDAGTAESSDRLITYLTSAGVGNLDYVVATHPHEDHIGGMTKVLDSFNVGKIIMPDIETTTKTFENFIDAIIDKDIPVSEPVIGHTESIGTAEFTILAPNSKKYKDLNDYSVVIKLSCKNTTFLFTGDATSVSEGEMLTVNAELASDVLLIGHHGSSGSTSDSFLKKVSPKYAVISVGKGNSYGHPTDKVLNKLTNAGIDVFRTDELGTIIAVSDGDTIKFENIGGDIIVSPEIVYIGNKSTRVFHFSWCTSVSKMKEDNKVVFESRDDCASAGYVSCNNCKP